MAILRCGVTLSLPRLIFWCFLFLSLPDLNQDPVIDFLFYLGRNVLAFLCASPSPPLSESLWVFVHKCITHIEWQNTWIIINFTLIVTLLLSSLVVFFNRAIDIVGQPSAWRSQTMTVAEYTVQYFQTICSLLKKMQQKWRRHTIKHPRF